MQMILNFFSPSILVTLIQVSPTFRVLCNSFPPGCLLTFLAHLILRISPHHSHHLRSHHLSLPPPFTPDLKLISFTNPFLYSHSYSFRTDFMDLNLLHKRGTGVVCFSFFFWLRVLDKAEYSAFESTLNSLLSYRIVS